MVFVIGGAVTFLFFIFLAFNASLITMTEY